MIYIQAALRTAGKHAYSILGTVKYRSRQFKSPAWPWVVSATGSALRAAASVFGPGFVAVMLVLGPGLVIGASATDSNYAQLTGSSFVQPPNAPFAAPAVREMSLPRIEDGTSIWGATGRDATGHIWAGISAESPGMSAHLFEYDPVADAWHDHGSVVERLRIAGLLREGEGQIKIHSKIVPGGDGWLYFASTDEEGEQEDGSALPRWGGHLWRIHPKTRTWEHLLATPEGLVAVSGVGRYIYALGYWDHVLYQYDTVEKQVKRVVVGSVKGHVSRNFIADIRGHAFVPRLRVRPNRLVSASLVEYDQDLNELADTPLDYYLDKERSAGMNHGIVGLAYLPDGRMVFTTHAGYLYSIQASGNGPAIVTGLAWLHPRGKMYIPSLFSFGGDNWLAGVARQRARGFEWIVSDLDSGDTAVFPIDTGDLQEVLLYGSISRDNAGRVYVGGWAADGANKHRPLMLQITPVD
jgi:hypothetical protein